MDKLNAMQAFARVVEAGTFTKAAESMGMPKTAVTRLIQSLEEHLRVKLLNRTTRRVTVTPDGAAYYERVRRVLADIDELEGTVSTARAAPRGRIRVDIASAAAQMLVLPALQGFLDRYPDIQVDMGVSDRPVDLLSDNVDCVVRGGEIRDPSLVARRVGEMLHGCCASPDYIRRHGMPMHPLDLESDQHQVVSYFSARTGKHFPFDFVRGHERYEVNGRYRVAVNDGNAYMKAARDGLGVIQAPYFAIKPFIDTGELVPFLCEWEIDVTPVYVVYPPNRHLGARLRVFVDWVAELFERHGQWQRDLVAQCTARQRAAEQMAALVERVGHTEGGFTATSSDGQQHVQSEAG